MLPRKYKLTKKQEIEDLAKTGKRTSSVFFNIKFKNNNKENERWIIVVSAKVSKSAVKRNKLRRQTREIIRTEKMGKMKQMDIMIVVKDNALGVDFSKLKKVLLQTLDKIN